MGRARRARLDGGDATRAHGDVGVTAGAATAVDQVSTADQQVVHRSPPASYHRLRDLGPARRVLDGTSEFVTREPRFRPGGGRPVRRLESKIAVTPARSHHPRALLALVVIALTLGAGPVSTVRVDDWDAQPIGPLNLSATWRRYAGESTVFKQPPAIVQDDGRPVLQLMTDREAMRVGRTLKVDPKKTPWLVWEWKPLVLPKGGDVRHPERNDQAGRVMVVFEGMKGILYVWDTTAPVGTEVRPDELEIFQRVLIVVRSGPRQLRHWSRERRNVSEDYRRIFGEKPRPIKLVGVESHSNDTETRTSMLFGTLRFERH